jgi:uncharacterized protein (TIGR02266 family)
MAMRGYAMSGSGGIMHYGRIRTSIETEFEVSGHRAKGRIKNVSESGVFVGTASIPEQGENVDLNFKAPGGEEVRLSGLVWWTTDDCGGTRHRAPGFGLRLLDDNEEFRQFWASLQ